MFGKKVTELKKDSDSPLFKDLETLFKYDVDSAYQTPQKTKKLTLSNLMKLDEFKTSGYQEDPLKKLPKSGFKLLQKEGQDIFTVLASQILGDHSRAKDVEAHLNFWKKKLKRNKKLTIGAILQGVNDFYCRNIYILNSKGDWSSVECGFTSLQPVYLFQHNNLYWELESQENTPQDNPPLETAIKSETVLLEKEEINKLADAAIKLANDVTKNKTGRDADAINQLINHLDSIRSEMRSDYKLNVALVGVQNFGKTTIINKLVGSEVHQSCSTIGKAGTNFICIVKHHELATVKITKVLCDAEEANMRKEALIDLNQDCEEEEEEDVIERRTVVQDFDVPKEEVKRTFGFSEDKLQNAMSRSLLSRKCIDIIMICPERGIVKPNHIYTLSKFGVFDDYNKISTLCVTGNNRDHGEVDHVGQLISLTSSLLSKFDKQLADEYIPYSKIEQFAPNFSKKDIYNSMNDSLESFGVQDVVLSIDNYVFKQFIDNLDTMTFEFEESFNPTTNQRKLTMHNEVRDQFKLLLSNRRKVIERVHLLNVVRSCISLVCQALASLGRYILQSSELSKNDSTKVVKTHKDNIEMRNKLLTDFVEKSKSDLQHILEYYKGRLATTLSRKKIIKDTEIIIDDFENEVKSRIDMYKEENEVELEKKLIEYSKQINNELFNSVIFSSQDQDSSSQLREDICLEQSEEELVRNKIAEIISHLKEFKIDCSIIKKLKEIKKNPKTINDLKTDLPAALDALSSARLFKTRAVKVQRNSSNDINTYFVKMQDCINSAVSYWENLPPYLKKIEGEYESNKSNKKKGKDLKEKLKTIMLNNTRSSLDATKSVTGTYPKIKRSDVAVKKEILQDATLSIIKPSTIKLTRSREVDENYIALSINKQAREVYILCSDGKETSIKENIAEILRNSLVEKCTLVPILTSLLDENTNSIYNIALDNAGFKGIVFLFVLESEYEDIKQKFKNELKNETFKLQLVVVKGTQADKKAVQIQQIRKLMSLFTEYFQISYFTLIDHQIKPYAIMEWADDKIVYQQSTLGRMLSHGMEVMRHELSSDHDSIYSALNALEDDDDDNDYHEIIYNITKEVKGFRKTLKEYTKDKKRVANDLGSYFGLFPEKYREQMKQKFSSVCQKTALVGFLNQNKRRDEWKKYQFSHCPSDMIYHVAIYNLLAVSGIHIMDDDSFFQGTANAHSTDNLFLRMIKSQKREMFIDYRFSYLPYSEQKPTTKKRKSNGTEDKKPTKIQKTK
ncbi:GTPase Der [Acrasis kona]|uniref:GTPase Der n=1 Tax=Acrasis kona TaxID=1008807 RepID=A0AAW2YUU2_9EUKA